MSHRRLLAAGSLLSLLAVAPFYAGCEDSSSSTPTPTRANPDFDGGAGVDSSVPSTCAPVTGPGTKHEATITADETWTAAASPHVVDFRSNVAATAKLTIEPCAVVQIKGGQGILVEGQLLAEGAADKPIRFERAEADKAWSTIEARATSRLRFAYVTVDGGGDANGGRPTQYGALDIRGDQNTATQPIFFADHVTVKGSQSLGIQVREGGGFAPGSKDLTITGGVSFPISIWGRASGTLPSGTYTGNATDEIILPASGSRDGIMEDTTLHDYGVPYRIGGPTGGTALVVAAEGTVPLLTLEAGVTLRFDKDVRLDVDSASSGAAIGALRVEGTAAKPVVLTSAAAAPAAGDWVGIVLEGTPDPRTEIAYAKISFAGGDSQISSYDCNADTQGGFGDDGAIIFMGGKPASAIVTNTVIENSAGAGIVRGWTGDPLELLSTNTFTSVVGCSQTFPKPQAGVCPDPAPCPK